MVLLIVKLMEFIENVIKRDDYKIKTINNKKLRVTVKSIHNYLKIMEVVLKNNLIGRAFTIK